MQGELDAAGTNVPIQLLGVCQSGFDSNNNGFTDGRDIPWLQDEEGIGAQIEWGAFKEDFVIVDQNGDIVEIIDLQSMSLVNSSNYDAVKQQLIDLANQ